MELLTQIVDFALHADRHLADMVQAYGLLTYLILFGIVFVETGIVFAPFLPGDSLIFAAGVMAGKGALNPHLVFLTLTAAAILGDSTNYWIGRFLGPRILRGGEDSRFLKKKHLDKTHEYFELYGGKTVIIARFVPIVRTLAPFVAGVGAMKYPRFLLFSIFGSLLWVSICTYAGFWFGGFEFVQKNFSVVVLAIIAVSLMPGVFEYLRHRSAAAKAAAAPAGETN